MPDFSTEVDIDPSEYVSECSKREKKELVDLIIEECSEDTDLKQELLSSIAEHFGESGSAIIESIRSTPGSIMHDEFIDSLIKLSNAYYSLSNEDTEKINELAKRF